MAIPPSWIKELANQVALGVIPFDVLSPLGCHYFFDEDKWEITVFASMTEIIGGDQDGKTRSSRFTFDIKHVSSLFEEIHHIDWQALQIDDQDELGAHVLIDGIAYGHAVAVRICAEAPSRFRSGRYAIVYESRLEDRW